MLISTYSTYLARLMKINCKIEKIVNGKIKLENYFYENFHATFELDLILELPILRN